MERTVIDSDSAKHYSWGRSSDSWVLADTPGLSVKQERMPPGAKEVLHLHSTAQQFFFVLKGVASFYMRDEKLRLKEQQGILVPATVKHFIANETTEDLLFLVISQPAADGDRTVMEEQTF